ncbi:hypothetical protein E8E12_001500 [Didymella heteroderae]|uniref:Transmembrane protein n=1 Tax=Didymella heteroderae TaxID=1769908 RepID=A0A9P4WGX4_9PLEO|nr:hypothetical protein E8E12_001500 [Didymella heteroderae]
MIASFFVQNLLVRALILIYLGTFVDAQTTQLSESSPVPDVSLAIGHQSFSTAPDGSVWSTISVSYQYGHKSTVRHFTTTNEEGQTQILADVTIYWEDEDATRSTSEETRATHFTSIVPSMTGPDSTTTVAPETSPEGLPIAAVAGISVGATSAALVVAVGIYSLLRQRRRAGKVRETAEVQETRLQRSTVYVKAELHATERAMYELDGKDALPELGSERESTER